MSKTSQDHIEIFDTTLRDGEQSAGTAMTVRSEEHTSELQSLEIGRAHV